MAEPFETVTKDPDSVLDYVLDWVTRWLETGDTISTSTWTVPAGITKDSDTNTNTTTTIWVSGGTDDTDYDLTNRVVTAGGRTVDRTLRIQVRER